MAKGDIFEGIISFFLAIILVIALGPALLEISSGIIGVIGVALMILFTILIGIALLFSILNK